MVPCATFPKIVSLTDGQRERAPMECHSAEAFTKTGRIILTFACTYFSPSGGRRAEAWTKVGIEMHMCPRTIFLSQWERSLEGRVVLALLLRCSLPKRLLFATTVALCHNRKSSLRYSNTIFLWQQHHQKQLNENIAPYLCSVGHTVAMKKGFSLRGRPLLIQPTVAHHQHLMTKRQVGLADHNGLTLD